MTAGPVRVVFDTNILVSAHFWKGPPYRCMLAVEAGLAILVLAEPILIEFIEKLTVKFGVSRSDVQTIAERFRLRAQLMEIKGESGWVRQDPDDDKFIETAVVGEASVIVSGDRHLLALGQVEGIEILTARQLLERLTPVRSPDP